MMQIHQITDMRNFRKLDVIAESPEMALINAHAAATDDPQQHKYNDHLKNLCYNGDNIGLGAFCYFSRRRAA